MIDYDKFQKSLEHLELQYRNHKSMDSGQPKLIREAVTESVIQRFETCYDSLWKVLKRHLREELGIPEVPNNPKGIFRLAGENNLFASSTEQWLKYVQARIGTTHDYSGKKVLEAFELMDDFIEDAIGIYQTMSTRTWE